MDIYLLDFKLNQKLLSNLLNQYQSNQIPLDYQSEINMINNPNLANIQIINKNIPRLRNTRNNSANPNKSIDFYSKPLPISNDLDFNFGYTSNEHSEPNGRFNLENINSILEREKFTRKKNIHISKNYESEESVLNNPNTCINNKNEKFQSSEEKLLDNNLYANKINPSCDSNILERILRMKNNKSPSFNKINEFKITSNKNTNMNISSNCIINMSNPLIDLNHNEDNYNNNSNSRNLNKQRFSKLNNFYTKSKINSSGTNLTTTDNDITIANTQEANSILRLKKASLPVPLSTMDVNHKKILFNYNLNNTQHTPTKLFQISHNNTTTLNNSNNSYINRIVPKHIINDKNQTNSSIADGNYNEIDSHLNFNSSIKNKILQSCKPLKFSEIYQRDSNDNKKIINSKIKIISRDIDHNNSHHFNLSEEENNNHAKQNKNNNIDNNDDLLNEKLNSKLKAEKNYSVINKNSETGQGEIINKVNSKFNRIHESENKNLSNNNNYSSNKKVFKDQKEENKENNNTMTFPVKKNDKRENLLLKPNKITGEDSSSQNSKSKVCEHSGTKCAECKRSIEYHKNKSEAEEEKELTFFENKEANINNTTNNYESEKKKSINKASEDSLNIDKIKHKNKKKEYVLKNLDESSEREYAISESNEIDECELDVKSNNNSKDHKNHKISNYDSKNILFINKQEQNHNSNIFSQDKFTKKSSSSIKNSANKNQDSKVTVLDISSKYNNLNKFISSQGDSIDNYEKNYNNIYNHSNNNQEENKKIENMIKNGVHKEDLQSVNPPSSINLKEEDQLRRTTTMIIQDVSREKSRNQAHFGIFKEVNFFYSNIILISALCL